MAGTSESSKKRAKKQLENDPDYFKKLGAKGRAKAIENGTYNPYGEEGRKKGQSKGKRKPVKKIPRELIGRKL